MLGLSQILSPNNRLFELARSGQRSTHPLLTPIIVILCMVIIPLAILIPLFLLAVVGVMAVTGKTDPAQLRGFVAPYLTNPLIAAAVTGIGLLVGFGIPIGALGFWIHFFERRSFLGSLGFERSRAWVRYGLGFLVGAGLYTLVIAFLLGFGAADVRLTVLIAPHAWLTLLGAVLIILPGWLVQGASEEIMTRGFILPITGARWGPVVGITISTLFFAAMHSLNNGLTPLALFNLALAGLFFAFYALREGGLWGACAAHSAWNWAQGNLFGVAVSGSSAGASVFVTRAYGPDWLTGGEFGSEGGVGTTVVMLLACLVLVFLPLRRSQHLPSVLLPEQASVEEVSSNDPPQNDLV